MYKVIKRDGSVVGCDLSRIHQMIDYAKDGLEIETDITMFIPIETREQVSTKEIIQSIAFGIKSQIPQVSYEEAKKLDQILANIQLMDLDKDINHFIKTHYELDQNLDYGYKSTKDVILKIWDDLSENVRMALLVLIEKGLLNGFFAIISDKDPITFHPLSSSIVTAYRDLYSPKVNGHPILKLHEYYLLQALVLAQDPTDLQEVERLFNRLIRNLSLASPIRMSLLSDRGALTSCEILTPDDDLLSISSALTSLKEGSKNGRGFGAYWGHLRARGDEIQSIPSVAGGSYPYALEAQASTLSTQQLNLRKAGIAIYTDIFHPDILQFFDGKSQQGDLRTKVWDIFRGVAIPDYFFEKEEANEEWMLISPHESAKFLEKPLNQFFGDEFIKAYNHLDSLPDDLFSTRVYVNAKDLFKQVVKMAIQEGDPFIFYRDTANRYHMNDHKGDIYCSNLCSEILGAQKPSNPAIAKAHLLPLPKQIEELSKFSDDDVGYNPTCNLLSVSIFQFYYASHEEKESIMRDAIAIMAKILSQTRATDMEAEKYDRDFNPIGIGVMDWTSLLIKENIPYRDTPETKKFINEVMFDLVYHGYKASMEYAKTHGAYPAFEGSKYSKGILLPAIKDTDLTLEQREKLNILSQDIQKYGLYNGYLFAIAPNSGTSIASGQTASVYALNRVVNLVDSLTEDVFVIPQLSEGKPDIWYNQYLNENIRLKDLAFMYTEISKFFDQSISAQIPYNVNTHTPRELYEFYKAMFRNGAKTVYYSKTQTTVCSNCAN